MAQAYQDAMALVRQFGKPDLFVTMTCNPSWPEIRGELKQGETPNDRPDLICRVFRLKLKELLHDLEKKGVFGAAVACVHVVEFQKRGLPHAHILIILSQGAKPRTADDIDKMVSHAAFLLACTRRCSGAHRAAVPPLPVQVSAELPDQATHPRLYKAVTSHMLHGPCATRPCAAEGFKDGKCTKQFPKDFQAHTLLPADGFPSYMRRENQVRYVK